MEKIEKQIEWYENNSTRKEDDYTRLNLQLINGLYDEIDYFEDLRFVDKVISTFCEIIEMQREVIAELEYEVNGPMNTSGGYTYQQPAMHNFVAMKPVSNDDDILWDESDDDSYGNDQELQEDFTAYCLQMGKSSYTVNDYCSRIKNLWKTFYDEYTRGELVDVPPICEETIDPKTPLLNVHGNYGVIDWYVNKKIAECEGNRNWANSRAAFNKFKKFIED